MLKRNMIQSVMLILLFILLLPLLPSLASAQMEEYKEYTVVKGDTLWDISHTELQDPFLWPKIWKVNPDISNPDLIYPNQIIKIPLYVLQKEISIARIPGEVEVKKEVPEVEIARKIEPIKREYLVDRDLLTASGYIADSVESVGSIVGSPSGRRLFGKDDYAYIETDNPATVGDKFYVIRSAGKVKHPQYGHHLGYLIEILGIAEVIGQDNGETKVMITASYSDIPTGSLLETFYEIEPPYLTEVPRKPDINGYVVATKELRTITGMWDIVYIDKGKRDGLEIGDLLATIKQQEKYRIKNSSIQIINIRESTATALVRKGIDVVLRGDEVVGIK